MDTKTKEERMNELEKEFREKYKKVLPECAEMFATKGFDAAINYAMSQGVNFAVSFMKKALND